jgi:threonine dehydrogenase-like Zn-dependent dehydrogenase
MSDTLAGVTRYVRLAPGVVELTGGPPADVPPGCARIAVAACGLCSTDLHLLRRRPAGMVRVVVTVTRNDRLGNSYS